MVLSPSVGTIGGILVAIFSIAFVAVVILGIQFRLGGESPRKLFITMVKSRFWIGFGTVLFLAGLTVGAMQVAFAFRQPHISGGRDPQRVSVSIEHGLLPISIALAGMTIAIIGTLRPSKHRNAPNGAHDH